MASVPHPCQIAYQVLCRCPRPPDRHPRGGGWSRQPSPDDPL